MKEYHISLTLLTQKDEAEVQAYLMENLRKMFPAEDYVELRHPTIPVQSFSTSADAEAWRTSATRFPQPPGDRYPLDEVNT